MQITLQYTVTVIKSRNITPTSLYLKLVAENEAGLQTDLFTSNINSNLKSSGHEVRDFSTFVVCFCVLRKAVDLCISGGDLSVIVSAGYIVRRVGDNNGLSLNHSTVFSFKKTKQNKISFVNETSDSLCPCVFTSLQYSRWKFFCKKSSVSEFTVLSLPAIF